MKYMGSKNKLSKYIAPIIQHIINKYNIKTYVEPFVGGCNMIDKIKCARRIGTDKQEYLINLLRNVHKITELPEECSKELYAKVRDDYRAGARMYDKWYIGAIGFLASYNGRFFDGGYAGIKATKDGKVRNYFDEAKRNLVEQIPSIESVEFFYKDYKYISHLKNCLIYCDPPYANTKQYDVSKNFDYSRFWDTIKIASKNNLVLVSEQTVPSDCYVLWSQEMTCAINHSKTTILQEKLVTYNKELLCMEK